MDTVVAAATPWGRSAIAVLRLSGPEARAIAAQVCPGGPAWRPRRVALRRARDGERLLDEVLAVWMPGPHSATGEDVVELSCHGNPVIVEALLDRCVRAGARPARSGEFTRRALENGRTDLLRAEALAGLVSAGSPEGVRLAQAGLAGAVTEVVAATRERLLDLAAELEARFDSPGEDLEGQTDAAVAAELQALAEEARETARTWAAGRARLHGARVALVGPVNAGKSSLFNALLGERRALVSPEPGTTRDVVERAVLVRGLEITLLDTAGERALASALEAEGQALGRALTADVDLTLVVFPLHVPPAPELAPLLARSGARLVVGTHADCPPSPAALALPFDARVASTTGEGIDALRNRIRDAVDAQPPTGARVILVSARQQALFRALAEHAAAAALALTGPAGPAVAAEELTAALERLAELDGSDAREAVLDRVFARFCIGK